MKKVAIGIWILRLRKTQENDMVTCLRTFYNSLDSYWIKFVIEADKWLVDEINKSNKKKK